ncbi:lysylphosphatidylglycerol synthase transmembrane domain-containing protein [Peptostreptococcus russellii]|uniref:lysylphosphatidylglycerol synthase transmembrane domain-containing protein n=1 Tax=Peptostreptococcus russellii TaxID=215200 RepID=UPI003F58DBF6
MEGLQNKKSQLLGIGFMLILMIASIMYVLKDESINSVMAAIHSVKAGYILIAIALMLGYIICEGINIWITMRALNKKTSVKDCIEYGFVGFYFSSITPSSSGGQPAQVYFMNRKGISITSSSLGLMILLFAHQLVVMLYGLIALFIKPEFMVSHKAGFHLLLAYGLISNAIILFGILFLIFSPKLVFKILNTMGKLLYKIRIIKNKDKLREKISQSLEEYERGAIYMKENPKILLYVILVTILQITMLFAIPYVIYLGFGLRKFSMMDLILTQAILNIAVSSLPLPGAVGASESVFVDMFRNFFGSLVVPGMLLTRIANFYIVLIISGIVSLISYIKK